MTASPTPPDFFAESANKSGEHHADSAYCSDAQVGLPSEGGLALIVENAQSGLLTDRDAARAILDLIRPAFEAKEREIERITNNRDMWKGQSERQAKTLFDLRMQILADEGQSREQ